jgi:hypothetical protein
MPKVFSSAARPSQLQDPPLSARFSQKVLLYRKMPMFLF